MMYRGMGSASAGNLHRRAVAGAVALAVTLASAAAAQQPAPTPAAPKMQPKKPKSEATQAPAVAPAQPPAAAPAAAAQPLVPANPQFIFSPWTRVCGKEGPESVEAKPVCAVITDARVETGQEAVSVALVEVSGNPEKILRLTLPLGVRLDYGTRVIIDHGAPQQSNYVMCLAGCSSDYKANADLLEKLRKGQTLTVQAISPNGSPISVDVPLREFAKAYDGPATDEKVVEEQHRKQAEELKARAEEARKKLETQQAAGSQSGPSPAGPSPTTPPAPSPAPAGGSPTPTGK